MTDKHKLIKIKKLADALYDAAANQGPVGSGERLHKAMDEYHQFIIQEWHKEEPKKCVFALEHYTEEDRKILCEDCRKVCEYNKKEGQKLSNVERTTKNWKEEPVSNELWEATQVYYEELQKEKFDGMDVCNAFKAGAKWQKEQFENNRLKHCDSITNEQAELEQGFAVQHLDKHNRIPTYLDAIEYGMNLQKEQMMKYTIKCEITWMDGFMLDYTQEQQDDLLEKIGAKVGDKVKLVIIKED